MLFGQPNFEGEMRPSLRKEKKKPYVSRIVLNFFRHGDKEKAPPPGLEAGGDKEVRLTPAGRKGAVKVGEDFRLPSQGMEQAIAKGSTRKRTQETSGMVMAGNEAIITGDETLEELKAKIDGNRKYGSKIGVDKRLDFETGSGDFKDALMAAAKGGNLFEWLVENSDQAAVDNLEKVGLTYARAAKNIAEIVAGYLKVSNRWDNLVDEKGYQDTLLRHLGSHQTVTESFLAKAIEKTKGIEEREKFVEALKNGFGFVEGYSVEIQTDDKGERHIYLHFQKQDENGKILFDFNADLPEHMLQEIIEEGEELDQLIAERTKKAKKG